MADARGAAARGRKKWVFPQKSTAEERAASARPAEAEANAHLSVPFRGHISGGLQPGKRIVLVAVVDPRPDRFYVALTCGRGSSREPPPDVALELCVRFGDRHVVRRACVSGSWGDAERAIPYFPFIRGQPFKLEVRCERTRFRLFVDGVQLCDFLHRLTSLGDVDTLWIKGSIAVTKLA